MVVGVEVFDRRLAAADDAPRAATRLADGRGWVFDRKPGVGSLCVRHETTLWNYGPAPRACAHARTARQCSQSQVFGVPRV